MYKIRTEFNFSAAHTLPGHPKCGKLHGHNYRVVIKISTPDISEKGWIADFGVIKAIGEMIIDPLDHLFIYSRANHVEFVTGDNDDWLGAFGLVKLDIPHSTAECLAEWFWKAFAGDICVAYPRLEFFTLEVEVWETTKSMASYENVVRNTESAPG